MIYKAKRKKDNKNISGFIMKIRKKYYLIPAKITKYYNADYIWLNGGIQNYEIFFDTLVLKQDK
jgi:hypothetical protein